MRYMISARKGPGWGLQGRKITWIASGGCGGWCDELNGGSPKDMSTLCCLEPVSMALLGKGVFAGGVQGKVLR